MALLITEYEKVMRDNLSEEAVDLYGTTVTFYSLKKLETLSPGSDASVLYGEPGGDSGWKEDTFEGVKVFFNNPAPTTSTGEKGEYLIKTAEVTFPKGYLDRLLIPAPKKGDYIFHPAFGYYDITEVTPDGYYSDNHGEYFTMYVCQTEFSSKYSPEKKV